ncbi:MAG: hypothetical protein IJF87_06000 [Erysipelotrichaceae bacterium]|nr:hypothetical protein [Erysipelotrichaceae bacterium]
MPRDGTKNLIPVTKRSKEEAKEISRQGGIKSGEARRQKRLFRDALEEILYSKSPNGKLILDDASQELVNIMLNGDDKDKIAAFNTIRDTIGQKPIEQMKAEIDLPVFQNDLDE